MAKDARDFLNCWIVAMRVWLRDKGVYPVAIRSSHAWWFVPHFIATFPSRWRHFHAVEFVPPRRVRWSGLDFVVLFRGRYRVVEYRAVTIKWFKNWTELQDWRKINKGEKQ